jgi:alcohol dehydrogenase (NADP+)
MITKGYAALAADAPLTPYQFERRAPGRLDVQIAIEFCGICHSDIHFARNEWGMTVFPCLPGHEIVGRVVKVGDDVKKVKVGERVAVGCFVHSCGTCASCKEGNENYCETGMTMTYGSPDPETGGKTQTLGGYSNQIVVTEHFVLKVPANLDPAGTAPLLCAGITTYSPLRHVGVGKGSRVAVMGLGGLGHMAVKLAASFGAEVTVLSRSPGKKADAQKLGAHDFVLTRDDNALAPLAGRFNAIVDTISAKHDINGALGCLKRDGTLVLVGASPQTLDLSPFPLIFGRRKVMGSLVGGIPETQEMLDHCGKHGITSEIEMTTPDKINDAYERTLKGDVKYRFVIDCSKF